MQGSVRKRGNKWYYYFDLGKIDGERKKYERVAEGAKTKAQAEAILRKKMNEYENVGVLFTPSEITLHDFLQFWLDEYVQLKLSVKTYYNYSDTIKNHIIPHLGKYKLKSLTPHVLQQFINLKTREGYARQTLNIISSILNKSLRQAVYPYEYIKDNPMSYVEILKETNRKPTKDDLKIQSKENLRLISSILAKDHPFYLPFHIGLHCGLRVGEVCGLEWKHIDFDEMTITIEQQLKGKKDNDNKLQWVVGDLKTKASYRTLPVGRALINILKEVKVMQLENQIRYGQFYANDPNHDFVCKKENGAHCTPSVIKYHTRETISKKLKIKFNYHSLRHTHATMLIESGQPTKTIQKRLGHSRAAITEDRYIHLTEKMARDAADVFDSIMNDL